jgi:predicted small metal-binding protein
VIYIIAFCCKDCGLDCSFQVTGKNESQVAHKIIHHMHEDHGMNTIPADFMIKIKHSITYQNINDTGSPPVDKILVASKIPAGKFV